MQLSRENTKTCSRPTTLILQQETRTSYKLTMFQSTSSTPTRYNTSESRDWGPSQEAAHNLGMTEVTKTIKTSFKLRYTNNLNNSLGNNNKCNSETNKTSHPKSLYLCVYPPFNSKTNQQTQGIRIGNSERPDKAYKREEIYKSPRNKSPAQYLKNPVKQYIMKRANPLTTGL